MDLIKVCTQTGIEHDRISQNKRNSFKNLKPWKFKIISAIFYKAEFFLQVDLLVIYSVFILPDTETD